MNNLSVGTSNNLTMDIMMSTRLRESEFNELQIKINIERKEKPQSIIRNFFDECPGRIEEAKTQLTDIFMEDLVI
jgi:predicted KAP-like P-loop ATPase